MNEQQLREWMMAQQDGELTAEQIAELERSLQDPALRQIYEEEYPQMLHVKTLTRSRLPQDLPPEKWDQYWLGVYPRLERGLAWILMSIGALILIGWGSWEAAREWIINPDIPLWIKVAGISFWAGCAIMLVSVVREKLFLHKHERYKDIQR